MVEEKEQDEFEEEFKYYDERTLESQWLYLSQSYENLLAEKVADIISVTKIIEEELKKLRELVENSKKGETLDSLQIGERIKSIDQKLTVPCEKILELPLKDFIEEIYDNVKRDYKKLLDKAIEDLPADAEFRPPVIQYFIGLEKEFPSVIEKSIDNYWYELINSRDNSEKVANIKEELNKAVDELFQEDIKRLVEKSNEKKAEFEETLVALKKQRDEIVSKKINVAELDVLKNKLDDLGKKLDNWEGFVTGNIIAKFFLSPMFYLFKYFIYREKDQTLKKEMEDLTDEIGKAISLAIEGYRPDMDKIKMSAQRFIPLPTKIHVTEEKIMKPG